MTEPMADKRLAEIRARANAATSGPWTWSPGMIEAPGTDEHLGSEIVLWASNIPGEYDDDDAAAALGACGSRAESDAAANLEFLAAAREDIPALLAEVDRLRAQQGIPRVQYGVRFPDDDNVMTAPTVDIARAWVREYANLTSTTEAARVQRRTVTRNATAWEDVDQ